MIEHYRRQAYCNLWSNHRLLSACAGLPQDEFMAERTSFFPSIWLTLNHIHVVDAYYLDALEGGTHGLAIFDDKTPHASVAALRPAQRELDMRLVRLCESLDRARLNATVALERDDHSQREPTHRVLLHLFVHQTHHRGQVHAMLSGTSVAPPQLDEFWLTEEATLRRVEFEALGISERDIWADEADSTSP